MSAALSLWARTISRIDSMDFVEDEGLCAKASNRFAFLVSGARLLKEEADALRSLQNLNRLMHQPTAVGIGNQFLSP